MRLLRRIYDIVALPHPWARLKYAFSVWLQDPTLYPLGVYPAFDADLCATVFMRNQAVVHWYAKANGAHPMTYLQPFNGCSSRPLSAHDVAALAHMRRRVTVDGMTELDAMRAYYRRVAADFAQRQDEGLYDLTSVFDRDRSHVYIDQVHCSDIGYDLIARRIAADILKHETAGR
jgi:lysophospholipase L1-like esterase